MILQLIKTPKLYINKIQNQLCKICSNRKNEKGSLIKHGHVNA